MPTNRRRTRRTPRQTGITPSELEWLSGEPQDAANRFWKHDHSPERMARRRELLDQYPELIPPGRVAELRREITTWTEPEDHEEDTYDR